MSVVVIHPLGGEEYEFDDGTTLGAIRDGMGVPGGSLALLDDAGKTIVFATTLGPVTAGVYELVVPKRVLSRLRSEQRSGELGLMHRVQGAHVGGEAVVYIEGRDGDGTLFWYNTSNRQTLWSRPDNGVIKEYNADDEARAIAIHRGLENSTDGGDSSSALLGDMLGPGGLDAGQDVNSSFTSVPDAANELRVIRNLYIRIAEAKDLKVMDRRTRSSDPYCVVTCGGGQHIRTPTIWRTLEPAWLEEYTIPVTAAFKDVRAVVWDDNKMSKPEVIGQCVISKANLADQHVHEQWYPLMPLETAASDFVSGDIHCRLLYTPWDEEGGEAGKVVLKICEGRNLPAKDANGFSDPYTRCFFGSEKQKTEVIKKTLNPVFNHTMEFAIEGADAPNTLLLSVWDWDRVGSDDFMGQVSVPLSDYEPGVLHDLWLDLSPRLFNLQLEDAGEDGSDAGSLAENLGSLRLKLNYTEDRLLPIEEYRDLHAAITAEGLDVAWVLGLVTKEREPVARNLVSIFQHEGMVVDFITDLIDREVANTLSPGVLFRGNSITTKAVDVFMKMFGSEYLGYVLDPILKRIFSSTVSVEVDPTRVDDGESVEANQVNLTDLMDFVLDRIFGAVEFCPQLLRRVFKHLHQSVRHKFPDAEEVPYTAVSGFLFLRYFCAAILGPKLFGLWPTHPAHSKARSLTLVAKTLQNLANLVEFGQKEPFMEPINGFINANLDRLKGYVEALSDAPESALPKAILERPNVDLQRELAYAHGHIHRNYEAMAEHPVGEASPAVAALGAMLEALADAEDRVIAESDSDLSSRRRDRHLTFAGKQAEVTHDDVADANVATKAKFEAVDHLRSMLSRGHVFTKHGKRGKPHPRLVYCVLTDRKIWWREENKKKPDKKHHIVFKDMTAVRKGHTTKNFKRTGKIEKEPLAFSIIATTRTLDLECETEAERDEWVTAFEFLLQWQGTPPKIEQSNDEAGGSNVASGSGAATSDAAFDFTAEDGEGTPPAAGLSAS